MTETFRLSTSEIEPFTPESYITESLDDQYLRCAALIEVFSLVDHVWYRVPVLHLGEPEWMEDPWDQLELSPQRKTLLRTLVNTHTNQSQRSSDLIKKKGKGLVFLFHGQPGLGKTLTAEALSESIKRPLYRVNIGLLAGHQDWEPDLEKIFRDAFPGKLSSSSTKPKSSWKRERKIACSRTRGVPSSCGNSNTTRASSSSRRI